MNVMKKGGVDSAPRRGKKPVVVKAGNTSVRVYLGTCRKDGVSYPLNTVVYYEAGRRIRKNFADLDEAKREAEKVATRLDTGERDAARMNNSDAQAFALAKRELAPLGTPILEAVRAYIAAMKALPEGSSLLAASQFYASRHTAQTKRKPVPEVVSEFIGTKEADGLSEGYLQPLRSLLAPNAPDAKRKPRNSFAEVFKTYIDTVTTADMDAWIRARNVGARRRRNIALTLRTVFNFARDMGYLPKGQPTEADGLNLPKKKAGKIGIFTPAELRTLLTGPDEHPLTDEAKLWLAIGAFSGIRSAEMLRLEWGKHIQLEKRQIVISDDIAKTSARRIIRMSDNLAAWLAPFRGRKGHVFATNADERSHAYASRLGVDWKPNALRHSFISYAVALTQNVAAVSLEAGNSPAIIKTNYMELVDLPHAEEWFSIMPAGQPANVVPMKGAA